MLNFIEIQNGYPVKYMRKQIIESILIFLFGGLFMGYLMCSTCFEQIETAISTISYSGLIWLFLWKGNELLVIQTDKRLPWLEAPQKRFFISFGLMLVYTILASSIISYVFYIMIFKQDFNAQVTENIIQTVVSSIIFTSFIMLIFISISFFKSWRQAAINEEKFRKEHISSQYEALKNQVNPHFLFNSLNALSSLVYENQDKAVEFINRLSDVYRYVLDTRDKEVVRLSDEMEFVSAFLQLQYARHESNLNVSIDIQSMAGYVLPLSIQMLVENAIKHNIVSDEEPLHIDIVRQGESIVVSNRLQPKLKVNSSNQGLANIKSRYAMVSDQHVMIEDTGGVFKVVLPILKMEA